MGALCIDRQVVYFLLIDLSERVGYVLLRHLMLLYDTTYRDVVIYNRLQESIIYIQIETHHFLTPEIRVMSVDQPQRDMLVMVVGEIDGTFSMMKMEIE